MKNKLRVVEKPEIIVRGSLQKPYYEIRYREVGAGSYNIGFGSYMLKNVYKWLEEEFEIVDADKMIKCEVCGYEFAPIFNEHYIARDCGKTGIAAAFGTNLEEELYDAFDCPVCGCQARVQERKRFYSGAVKAELKAVEEDSEDE